MNITKPMAAHPWQSYRYRGEWGHIAIGASDDADAMKQAKRSLTRPDSASLARLDRWNGRAYEPVQP